MPKAKQYPVSCRDITPELEFYEEAVELQKKAESYLLSFYWCLEVKECFLYTNIGDVFAIYLFDIINTASDDDNLLWVVAGDIPSMYLDVIGPRSTTEVLEDYITLAEDWIEHVKTGQSVETCFPFNADPSIELAKLLETKISFMSNTLVHHIDNITLKK